jgi:hypothetical protein
VIPHLVEVWGEYESKGLVILALSDESASTVEPFLSANGVTYPVGSGSGSKRLFQVSGIPAAFLIDHNGTILWSGHPGNGGWTGLLDDALAKAEQAKPGWDPGERPEFLNKAVSFAQQGALGKSWKETESLRSKVVDEPEKIAAIELFQADFLQRAAARTAELERFYTRGLYFGAQEFLAEQMKIFKGSPPEMEWAATVKSWSKDADIKALLDLDKKRVKAMELAWDGKADKARDALASLRKKAKGTAIYDEIQSNLEAVSKM